ncbi:MAG: hypothetical protein EGP89_00190 [Ruminococcaceae bacterium]|nr:hypothetical protein [Oscillospiraceae bacterium]
MIYVTFPLLYEDYLEYVFFKAAGVTRAVFGLTVFSAVASAVMWQFFAPLAAAVGIISAVGLVWTFAVLPCAVRKHAWRAYSENEACRRDVEITFYDDCLRYVCGKQEFAVGFDKLCDAAQSERLLMLTFDGVSPLIIPKNRVKEETLSSVQNRLCNCGKKIRKIRRNLWKK